MCQRTLALKVVESEYEAKFSLQKCFESTLASQLTASLLQVEENYHRTGRMRQSRKDEDSLASPHSPFTGGLFLGLDASYLLLYSRGFHTYIFMSPL